MKNSQRNYDNTQPQDQMLPSDQTLRQGQGLPQSQRLPQGQGLPQGQRLPQGQGLPPDQRLPQGQGLPQGQRPSQDQMMQLDQRQAQSQNQRPLQDQRPPRRDAGGVYPVDRQRHSYPGPGQSTSSHRRPGRRRPLALGWVILFDTILLGVGLVVFALFHHVLPRELDSTGQVLPGLTDTVSSSNSTEQIATLPNSGASAATDATIPPGPTSAETSATQAATQSGNQDPGDPAAQGGMWVAKFPGRFTSGAVEQTDTSYKSAHVNVSLKKVQGGGVTYYLADIYLSDLRYFRTAFAKDKYGRGFAETVVEMGQKHQAILAVNGDYYGIRNQGVVIRNGELYRQTPFRDVLVMNNDGSMQTFAEADFNIKQIIARGAWQAWSFGPMLLDQKGQPLTTFNSDVRVANPRTALGYYEPGHYCLLLVDGRQPGYSNGLSLKDMAQLFSDLGCKAAYNLDGGQSSVMTFMGKVANQPYNGGRKSSDIVYVADQ